MKPLLVLLVLATLLGVRSQIENGEDAEQGQFPFAVRLHHPRIDYFKDCAGVILNKNWVLTCGHCVKMFQRKTINMNITVGDVHFNEGDAPRRHRRTYTSSDVFVHPGMMGIPHYFDIALLYFQGDGIQMNPLTQPIQQYREIPDVDQECTAMGWGNLVYERMALAETLQHAKLRVGSLTQVRELVPGRMYRADYEGNTKEVYLGKPYKGQLIHLPRGENGGRILPGDSGSPLICKRNGKKVLVGVATGSRSFHLGSSMYVGTHAAQEWIEDVMREKLMQERWEEVEQRQRERDQQQPDHQQVQPPRGQQKPLTKREEKIQKRQEKRQEKQNEWQEKHERRQQRETWRERVQEIRQQENLQRELREQERQQQLERMQHPDPEIREQERQEREQERFERDQERKQQRIRRQQEIYKRRRKQQEKQQGQKNQLWQGNSNFVAVVTGLAGLAGIFAYRRRR